MADGKPWEPDPRNMGNNWTGMFETRGGRSDPPREATSPAAVEAFDDTDSGDLASGEYRPWILQRGRSPGAMLLGLRWFDAKAGLWHVAAIAYPSLYAIDCIGDRMVSLDFGTRNYVIEGTGLDDLARHLQQGTVVAIQQYAAPVWPRVGAGAIVTAIRSVTAQS